MTNDQMQCGYWRRQDTSDRKTMVQQCMECLQSQCSISIEYPPISLMNMKLIQIFKHVKV